MASAGKRHYLIWWSGDSGKVSVVLVNGGSFHHIPFPPSAQGRERSGLAKLAVLMVFQVGLDCPDIQRSLHPLGTMLAQDSTVMSVERAEVRDCMGGGKRGRHGWEGGGGGWMH
jgi:hypothetical protein